MARNNPLAGVKFNIGIIIEIDDKQMKELYKHRRDASKNKISEAIIAKLIGGRLASGERLTPDVLDINEALNRAVAQKYLSMGRSAEGMILADFLRGLTELEIKQTSEGVNTKLFELQIVDSKGNTSDNPLARRIASGNISEGYLKEGITKEDYKSKDIYARIESITSQGWLKLLDSNSLLKAEAQRKLKNLAIITSRDGGKRLAMYGIRDFQYNLRYMKADVRRPPKSDAKGPIKIRYLLKDNVEQAIIKKIEDAVIKADQMRLTSLKFSELQDLGNEEGLSFEVPSGGSIPFMAVNYRRGMFAADKGAGSSPTPPKRSFSGMQFISREVLSAIIRNKVSRDMPHGPIGGPPLSESKLTYRTGRFVNSIKIDFLDFKRRLISYFYNPIYTVHEATRRDPRKLVERNIRQELQQRYGKQFRIFKSDSLV